MHPKSLHLLNQCRLFLQVLSLSDITDASGSHILSGYHSGARHNNRVSTLKWPRQPKPSRAPWTIWKNFLHHFHVNGKLLTPLGPWTGSTHQSWHTYEQSGANIVFRYDQEASLSQVHHPITTMTARRRLRIPRLWFSSENFREMAELPNDVVPITLIHHKDNPSLFYS